LLISGGCGLNCDWNSQWKNCGLFSEVFVPPCTNDSGTALGAAIDAQFYYTGNAKIEWDVYMGSWFLEDIEATNMNGFVERSLNIQELCKYLAAGKVFAWVQGRTEMGPRALGNRSLLAAPFDIEIRDKLNKIKHRERFRPIAPICLEEELEKHFEHQGPSPYMLYFQRVKSPKLLAVTHVDGSARVQTVNQSQNPEIYSLLMEFKELTGFGVLCNTSLNFPGFGFINRLSDLVEYAKLCELDGFVIGKKIFMNGINDPLAIIENSEFGKTH
jgi:predicted NodU family carbamoyl transferase